MRHSRLCTIGMRAWKPSARPATRATRLIAWTCTTKHEAGDLGPADPAVSLAAGRAGRVQLVVGGKWRDRPPHLVGRRHPVAADLPASMGLLRQLDLSIL